MTVRESRVDIVDRVLVARIFTRCSESIIFIIACGLSRNILLFEECLPFLFLNNFLRTS